MDSLSIGGMSFLAAMLALVFPETLNKPLLETIDDVELTGLAW